MNFTKYRFNNRQETLREKRNMHLITSCTYTQSTAMQNRVFKKYKIVNKVIFHRNL
jgi:hypothetical protein